jgi:hypothetical protein
MTPCLRIAGIATAAMCLAGCGSPTEPAHDGPLSLATVAEATVANRASLGLRTVVRDSGRWRAVWSDLWGDAAPALPDVDFEREMVVVASASLVCFAQVRVESVESSQGVLRVGLADSGPSTTCLCAAPETTFHAARLRRVEGAVEFVARTIPPTCP